MRKHLILVAAFATAMPAAMADSFQASARVLSAVRIGQACPTCMLSISRNHFFIGACHIRLSHARPCPDS